MGDTLTWDLVARDKSFEATINRLARSMDGFTDHMETAARRGSSGFTKLAKDAQDSGNKIDSAFDGAAKKIASDLDRIQREAWDSGRDMDREFVRSLQSVRDELDRVRADAARTGSSLDSDLGAALRNVKRDMEKLGDQARDTGKEIRQELTKSMDAEGGSFGEVFSEQVSGGFDVGGMIEGLSGGAGGAWAAAGGAVGALFADQAWKAMESVLSQRTIGGLIAAQNGGTVAEGLRAGKIAGESFYSGFADSIEAGGESLGAVVGRGLSDLGAPTAELQRLTDMASVAVKVVGEDANQIAYAAKQLLVTGLAENAEQAIDIIVAASQRGTNASDDLLDTIGEYSTKFRDLGLNGKEAMGLISQGMQAGARDTDVVADGLKELNNRVNDGSAARGLTAIGLSADSMRQRFAEGGRSAHDALRQILNGLNGIEDPAKRDQVALDLFGTKAEDLGDSLFALDLDTAAAQMEGFAGATDTAAKVLAATESPVQKFGRGWDEFLNDDVFGFLDKIEKVPEPVEKAGDATDRAAEAARGAATASHSYALTLQEVITNSEKMANDVLALSNSQIGYEAAIDAASESLKENGKTLDITTEKGRSNKSALDGIADSTWKVVAGMEAQNATTEEVRSFMEGARGAFVQMAIDMGMDAASANALADKLRLVPGNYVANVQLTGYELAMARANALEDKIRLMPSQKIINLRVNTSGSGSGGHFLAGLAEGGPAAAGEPYVVGEEGPELFVPRTSGRIIPNDEVFAASASGIRPRSGERTPMATAAAPVMVLEWGGGPSDELGEAAFEYFRKRIKIRHGGSVAGALGQRGVA